MRVLKTIWGLLFRLFPCPTGVGIRQIGNPGPDSPVLVTGNFHLTVKRLERALRGWDAWVLVCDSKGINVWCAAGADELDTHSVVSAVKTSGIGERVDHRILILPPLSAPGVRMADLRDQTGWKVKWGPVYAKDLPRFLAQGLKRDKAMARATYDLKQRLDTAMGALFPFYFLGALGICVFGSHLLPGYLVVGAVAFLGFMSLAPWLPGHKGLTKALFLDAALLAFWLALESLSPFHGAPFRAYWIVALVAVLAYGVELGGLASTMPSDFDPFLARMGIGSMGNVAFAGTIRTELLNGYRVLTYYRDRCKGCRNCEAVCPQGVWEMDPTGRAVLARKMDCTACRACLVQCEGGAIQAEPMGPAAGEGVRSTAEIPRTGPGSAPGADLEPPEP
jgi:NAD-dependent dihydropyrimidine dehydrogenase PreA subunit